MNFNNKCFSFFFHVADELSDDIANASGMDLTNVIEDAPV